MQFSLPSSLLLYLSHSVLRAFRGSTPPQDSRPRRRTHSHTQQNIHTHTRTGSFVFGAGKWRICTFSLRCCFFSTLDLLQLETTYTHTHTHATALLHNFLIVTTCVQEIVSTGAASRWCAAFRCENWRGLLCFALVFCFY